MSSFSGVFVKILFVCAIATICQAFVCPPNFCRRTVPCPVLKCEPNQIVRAGICGCCDTCVTILQPGDRCELQEDPLIAPQAECGSGTFCINGICSNSDY